jgi:2'-hydroxyisoflavone reductase
MRLLVLGGTVFLGRHVVEAALARAHDVTLFHRGRNARGLFPQATELLGDRDGGLAPLAQGEWDAAIDTSGFVPRIVRASAELLADRVGHYTFVSSGSAYADHSRAGMSEDAPLAELDEPGSEDVERHYGALKALAEGEVEAAFAGRSAIVRSGLIVGPLDPTNRFTYWVTRIAAGGRVLAPEPRDQAVQVIDGRDLAGWMVDLAERRAAGTFNAVGDVMTMEAMLDEIRGATASDAAFAWVPEDQLLEAGVEPWEELPLWLAPASDPGFAAFMAVSNARARSAGLRLRPLPETVADTLAWAHLAGPQRPRLDRRRELALLPEL